MTPWTVAHRLLCPWGFSRLEYWSGLPRPPPGDLPNPGIEPRSLALQADSLPPEPPEKPMNAGVSSLALLQRFFLTQESKESLLNCRRILYQPSFPGKLICYRKHTHTHTHKTAQSGRLLRQKLMDTIIKKKTISFLPSCY